MWLASPISYSRSRARYPMANPEMNGGLEYRVGILERDVAALVAGDRDILNRLQRMANDELERHGEVMRMIGELLDAVNAIGTRATSAIKKRRARR